MNFIAKSVAKLFGGDKSTRDIKEISPLVAQINQQFDQLSSLSNDELRGQTAKFRGQIKEYLSDIQGEIDGIRKELNDNTELDVHQRESMYNNIDELVKKKDEKLEEVLNDILPEAFATVKEASRRFASTELIESSVSELDKQLAAEGKEYIQINGDQVAYKNSWIAGGGLITWNMVHYDVQLIGGITLHQGKIAEMMTGEGKTLSATLPAYLNALAAEGVHIVTVNNYLAQRDSEWMGPLFEWLGITCDCIDKYRPSSPERIKAYRCDITYGTNNEFGFDYLRDNMVHAQAEKVQRKYHYAMVDEVDSVLIDDARTPLIISGPVPKGDQQEFHALKPRIQRLVEAQKKTVNGFFTQAKREIAEGKDGEKEGGLALLRAFRGLPKNKAMIKYLSEPGIKQKLLKTESYYLRDQSKDMPLVDEELFFTIEEKTNSVELTEKGIELITGAGEDSKFFVMPDVGAEIAEIEKSDLSDDEKLAHKDKLFQDFSVKSERIHAIQQLLKAYALFEKDVEYVVMDSKVKIVDEQTGRIMEGRRYSDGLHQAIEAKENVKVEAATQTFASITLQNYFRLYHKLSGMTGTAETEAGEFWEIYKLDVVTIPTNVPIQRDDKNDLVYKTAKEKYTALIEEVENMRKAGRPVLVGTTSVEVSELISRMLKLRGIKHNVLNAKQHQSEAQIVAEAGFPGQITIATNMAGRGTDIKLGGDVKEKGGLAIIGTERHDSRRVDRQLRGRAGRQGDVGSSQFFVSLEDNLMRLFTSDRIAKTMDRLGYKEGEVLQHGMITKSIERAQKKVEENAFGQRKRLLEYDDVMNAQRELIYDKRNHALSGERLTVDLQNMFFEVCEELVHDYQDAQDYENFKIECLRILALEVPFTEEEFLKGNASKLIDDLYDHASALYKRKSEKIGEMAFPVIKEVFETRGDAVKFIGIPFSDGMKALNVRANLEDAYNSNCASLIKTVEKNITLALVDEAWKEHLRQMDELKQSVQLAVHEQKDPLLIYKFEAFELFKQMLSELNRDVTSFLFRGQIPVQSGAEVQQARQPKASNYDGAQASRDDLDNRMAAQRKAAMNANRGEQQQKAAPVVAEPKVGRNDACPCGSGKKFKQCHGKQ